MTYLKVMNVLIAFASLAFVLTLAWQVRRSRLPVNRAIVALVIVFALRAFSRPFPPFGEDPLHLTSILDTVLLVAMVVLVLDGRRIVHGFQAQRQAAEQTQIEYDLALHSLEAGITERMDAELAAIEDVAATAGAAASDPRAQQQALHEIAERARALRSLP